MEHQSAYLDYQEQLHKNIVFRYFWQFWSNYSFVFFGVAALIMLASPQMQPYFIPVWVMALFAFLVARGICVTLLNIFYQRVRPYQKYEFAPITSLFFSSRTSFHNSFPSRHVTSYIAVATVVCLFFPAMGAALVAVALLTGLGRIILGYHWISDVVAGAILGTVVGYLTVYFGYAILFTK